VAAHPTTTAPRLSLLGGFELTCGPEQLRLCASAQRLIVYLAVHSRTRPIRRTALAERLWSEVPPQRAASNLRSALWRLPHPQGRELLDCTPTSVRLAPDITVDLWAGEEQARAISNAARLPRQQTAATVNGDALDILAHDLLPDWCEDWLLVEQESYRQTRLHALEQMCVELREAGRYPAALAAGLAAVQSEPLRESAHRRVIEVHLTEGNHAEALRQYQTFRRLLADELGLPPSPAIRRLVAPLLGRPVDDTSGGDVSVPARPRHR
jgi:DNA-binding SARP family transcriptional activator